MRPVAHISSLMSASNGETRAARESWRLTVVAVLVAVCGRKTLNWYSWRPCRPIAMSPPGKTDGRAADADVAGWGRAASRPPGALAAGAVADRAGGRGDRVAVGAGTAGRMLGGA